ncbi:MAG: hypothetical protein B7C55_12005 [Actinomycetales bacterium mxb001]|nr:MAG: hypothetical protein B7C55_12005 [Actinomycetales bacterium mxb001]
MRSSVRPLAYGDLVIDTDAWEVRLRGDVVDLTKTEFEILTTLAMNPRKVITDEDLTRIVWGANWFGDDGNLAVHISKLRHKLGESGMQPRYIRTVRGVGYRFDPGATPLTDVLLEAYEALRANPAMVEIVADHELVVAEVHTELPEILGWRTDGLLGGRIPFLANPRLRDPATARLEIEGLLARGFRWWSGSRDLPHADGRWLPADFVTQVLTTPDGELVGVRFVFVVGGGGGAPLFP